MFLNKTNKLANFLFVQLYSCDSLCGTPYVVCDSSFVVKGVKMNIPCSNSWEKLSLRWDVGNPEFDIQNSVLQTNRCHFMLKTV